MTTNTITLKQQKKNHYAVVLSALIGAVFLLCCVCNAGQVFANPNSVKVLSGISERFNRLVFNWPSPVTYDLNQSNGKISITFNANASADFSAVNFSAMPFVRNAHQSMESGKLVVRFEIPVDFQIQSFTTGTKTVFDILKNTNSPVTFSDNASSTKNTEQIKNNLHKAREQAKAEELKQAEPPKQETHPKQETNVEHHSAQKETQPQPQPQPQTETETETAVVKSEELPDVSAPEPENISKIDPHKFDFKNSFTVRPVVKSRMAVFTRGGFLWIVFDRKLSDAAPEMEGPLIKDMKPVMQFDVQGGTAYRLIWPFPTDSVQIIPKRDNLTWEVEFTNADDVSIDILPEVDFATTPNKPAVVLRTIEKPGKVLIEDPEIGDQLFVVTVFNDKIRSIANNRYPEFSMIPAELGAVVKPFNENIVMETVDDGVRVSNSERMVLSDESDLRAHAPKENLRPNRRMFDLVGWQSGSREYYMRNRRMMETHISQLEGVAKAAGYVDLAKLFVANALGAEALGALDVAYGLLPDLKKSPDFMALRGAANALFMNPQKAVEDLSFEPLKNQPEAHLWLGYAYSRMNEWDKAVENFNKVPEDMLASYPDRLRVKMLEAQVISYLETKEIAKAADALNILNVMPSLHPSDKAAYNYMSGRLLSMSGDLEGAEKMLSAAMSLKDRYYGVQARYDYINALYAQKKIDAEEAIRRFETIRFSWRGDEIEIKNLHRLGQLYIENKQYAEGLAVLREATILSKRDKHKEAMTADMSAAFNELYVKGKADELSPIKALSIFNEFNELLPAGEEGVVALKHLAERMVSVDLLKQAAQLFETLIQYHVSGQAAVELGTRLAVVRLLDFNPAGAIKALEETNNKDATTDSLELERLLLHARALSDMGKIDEALTLIEGKNDFTAMGLRSDINWRAGRWDAAATALEDLIDYDLKHPEKDNLETMKQQQDRVVDFVLKRGIALALSGKQRLLNNLYDDYHTLMEGTDSEAAFNIVVRSPQSGDLADIQTLQSRVNEVDLFDNFLKQYKTGQKNLN